MTLGSDSRPVQILLVEDNPADARLTQEAIRDTDFQYRLHLAEDGEEAMEFLMKEGDFADAPRPDLILLDLNLPGMDGREVLAEVKGDDSLGSIPVVVLTTSTAQQDPALFLRPARQQLREQADRQGPIQQHD